MGVRPHAARWTGATSRATITGLATATSVDIDAREEARRLAVWSPAEVINVNTKYGVTVRCAVVVPIRVRCTQCGVALSGTFDTYGTSRDKKRSVAENEARQKALAKVFDDARLSKCGPCGSWVSGPPRAVLFWCLFQLAIVIGLPVWVFFASRTHLVFPAVLLLSVLAAGLLYGNVERLRAGARRRLQPAESA